MQRGNWGPRSPLRSSASCSRRRIRSSPRSRYSQQDHCAGLSAWHSSRSARAPTSAAVKNKPQGEPWIAPTRADFQARSSTMKHVTQTFDTPWTSHQIEGSKGFEFIFNILGNEYTDAYNLDIVRVAVGGYSPLHIDPDNHAFYII